jgi:hypothetical protein
MDKKCIACRVWRIHDDFMQLRQVLKTCRICRANQKRWRGQHPGYMKQYRILSGQYKARAKASSLINPCLSIEYQHEIITFD